MTQQSPAKGFEIFGKNQDTPSDRFEVILDSTNINENPELDTIIPFTKRLRTDHIIIRGEYERLTIAIYGKLLNPEEANLLIKKQFDMSQQPEYQTLKKDEVSPLLTMEEEQVLGNAYANLKSTNSLLKDSENAMTIEEEPKTQEIVEIKENLKEKIEAQARNILDVYNCLISSPPPSNFCVALQELVENVEKVKHIL